MELSTIVLVLLSFINNFLLGDTYIANKHDRKILDYDQENCTIQCGAPWIFVIDNSGGMSEIISDMISFTIDLVATVEDTYNEPKQFVLVTFNDYNFTGVKGYNQSDQIQVSTYNTSNAFEDAISGINALTVGSDDNICEDNVMEAILSGLTVFGIDYTMENTKLVVFTDSNANDTDTHLAIVDSLLADYTTIKMHMIVADISGCAQTDIDYTGLTDQTTGLLIETEDFYVPFQFDLLTPYLTHSTSVNLGYYYVESDLFVTFNFYIDETVDKIVITTSTNTNHYQEITLENPDGSDYYRKGFLERDNMVSVETSSTVSVLIDLNNDTTGWQLYGLWQLEVNFNAPTRRRSRRLLDTLHDIITVEALYDGISTSINDGVIDFDISLVNFNPNVSNSSASIIEIPTSVRTFHVDGYVLRVYIDLVYTAAIDLIASVDEVILILTDVDELSSNVTTNDTGVEYYGYADFKHDDISHTFGSGALFYIKIRGTTIGNNTFERYYNSLIEFSYIDIDLTCPDTNIAVGDSITCGILVTAAFKAGVSIVDLFVQIVNDVDDDVELLHGSNVQTYLTPTGTLSFGEEEIVDANLTITIDDNATLAGNNFTLYVVGEADNFSPVNFIATEFSVVELIELPSPFPTAQPTSIPTSIPTTLAPTTLPSTEPTDVPTIMPTEGSSSNVSNSSNFSSSTSDDFSTSDDGYSPTGPLENPTGGLGTIGDTAIELAVIICVILILAIIAIMCYLRVRVDKKNDDNIAQLNTDIITDVATPGNDNQIHDGDRQVATEPENEDKLAISTKGDDQDGENENENESAHNNADADGDDDDDSTSEMFDNIEDMYQTKGASEEIRSDHIGNGSDVIEMVKKKKKSKKGKRKKSVNKQAHGDGSEGEFEDLYDQEGKPRDSQLNHTNRGDTNDGMQNDVALPLANDHDIDRGDHDDDIQNDDQTVKDSTALVTPNAKGLTRVVSNSQQLNDHEDEAQDHETPM